MRFVFFFLMLMPSIAFAQKKHKVKSGESIYSIAKLYNLTPKELATANGMTLTTGLKLNQIIKVPVKSKEKNNSDKPSQSNSEKTNPTSTPKEHVVRKGETLYQISKQYGVTVTDIKAWNNLKSDALIEGSKIRIHSSNATNAVKEEPVATIKEKPSEQQIFVTPAKSAENDYIKPADTVSKALNETKPKLKRDFNGGAFLVDFNTSKSVLKSETGRAAIFKSTSGWEDGKYYCLHNNASAGTIVKITSNDNQKVVYAKVLDAMPDIRQNQGLIIRISNAAADELGITKDLFDITVEY